MVDAFERLSAALAGEYRLERELGQGGMARVYLAEDLKHGRRVALKLLRPELAAMIGVDRFLAEVRTMAGLQHPRISFTSRGAASASIQIFRGGSLRRRRVDHRRDLGHPVGREATLPGMLAHHGFVRRAIDAVDLVAGHLAVDPLDLRAHLVEHAAGLLGDGLELGG
jgi:serine/threonine protein kinase